MRRYEPETDYARVNELLVRTHAPGAQRNWLQPRWEYMHHHAYVRRVDLTSIGLWESGDRLVAAIHPEHMAGVVYPQLDPDHLHLREELLDYAERELARERDGHRNLWVFLPDFDTEFTELARLRGYTREEAREDLSRFGDPSGVPVQTVPDGFRLATLAADDDPDRTHRLLWRGFNHAGDPPPGGREERAFMQSAPGFRKDLHVVVVSAEGKFVSYCGMWYEPRERYAYVEPVATDPDFRSRGLAEAAVLEAIRRAGELGATTAYVGTRMPFYLAFGFEPVHAISCWRKKL